MDGLKVEIIMEKFQKMLSELASIDTNVESKAVIDEIGIRVVQGAMNKTRFAKAGSIRERWKNQEVTTFNGKLVRLNWRFPNTQWAALKEQRNKSLETKLNARGTAKQNWIGFANSLGKTLKAPEYVVTANYKGRTHEGDSVARTNGTANAYEVTLIQSSPLIEAGNMEWALIRAISGEINYFINNMKHHFYLSQASRAAKYPGIFVKE